MQSEVLPAVGRLRQALAQAAQITQKISQTVKQAEEEASSPFPRHVMILVPQGGRYVD